jgi:inosose dehydratase
MPDLKWGYVCQGGRRREQHEIKFKQVSVNGFRGIELKSGTNRFSPTGRPDLIEINFGSAHNFVEFLHSCGIDQIVSYYYDPGIAFLEESSAGRSAAKIEDHEGIVESTRSFAKFLRDVGGSCLVVKAMGSYSREAPITETKTKTIAECWNKVGKMTKEYGVKTVMHINCLCAMHSTEEIEKLLSLTAPDLVGLALDTADQTIAGIDPVALYEKHYARIHHIYCVDALAADTVGEYKTVAGTGQDGGPGFTGGEKKIEQWYGAMGTVNGLVNFPALIKSVRQHNYSGWLVAENRQMSNSAHGCMLNGYYIKRVLPALQG